MRVHLIFGFLGSGKTTLLRHLLEQAGGDVPTGVIVNEFGEVGVDGAIVEGDAVDVVELNSGCMCCTLKGSLTDALLELRSRRAVDRVIVEATGVAQPAELIRPLADLVARGEVEFGPIVTVLDAFNFDRLDAMLGEFLDLQIVSADTLLLNKIDLVEPARIEAIRLRLRALNPAASLLYAEQCEVDPALLLDAGTSAVLAAQHRTPHHHHAEHEHEHEHNHDHGALDSFVIDSDVEFGPAAVQDFFRSLPGDVWRAKGFLRIEGKPMLAQYVLGRLELSPAPDTLHRALVFIGHALDRARITESFHRIATLQTGTASAET